MQIDFLTQFKPYLSEHCSEVGIAFYGTIFLCSNVQQQLLNVFSSTPSSVLAAA
jgi:hypothetical protein